MMYPFHAEQLTALAEQYGLPLFVYDAASITRQVQQLKQSFDVPSLEIRYACKALSTSAILRHINGLGCGLDTVSAGEIAVALKAGIPAQRISFTPSGVHTGEYAFAIEHGVYIHADQVYILEWLDEHFPGMAVTLRFNPGVRAGSHEKLQVGSEGSKFGFPAGQVEEIKRITDRLSLQITGVHMHPGSDIGDYAHFDAAYEFLLATALHWKDTLQHVDLGGGFKVPYHPGEPEMDMYAFGQMATARFNAFCAEAGRDIAMVLEPGKYLVSAAGCLLMEVTGVRQYGDSAMAYVASGFNHFLRPMSYDAYHHIVNISHGDGLVKTYDVAGYLCETDTFATRREIQEIRRGDVLCLMNAGAYGFTMASNYNTRPRPAEVLIGEDGVARRIRRAETIDDLTLTDLGWGSG